MPLPLPVGQHHLERPVDGERLAGAIDERERLPGRQRSGSRREHGVAGLRHDGRAASAPGLREDQRPGRVPRRLAQVEAAHAGRTSGHDQRPDHPDRLVRVDHQLRHAVAHELGKYHRVRSAGQHREFRYSAAVVGRPHLRRHPVDGPGDPAGLAGPHVSGAEAGRRGVPRSRYPRRQAAHPGNARGGEQRGDARADAARAVDADERRAATREHRRAAVAVPIGERGAG
jgi:hypothetical protein